MSTPTARALAGLLLLLVAGLLVYRPALDRVFVYDDILVVRDNGFITDPANLAHLSGEDYLRAAGERTYRPLVTATYILDHAIWGKSPFGFGLTNLLLHVFAAWLLGLVVRRLSKSDIIAGFSALLFCWHPALVEAVISPGNREEVLSVALILLAVYAYLRGREGGAGWRVLSPLALLASLYTMEWGVVVLPLLIAHSLMQRDTRRETARHVGLHVVVVAVFLVLYFFVHPRLPGEAEWLGGGPLGGLLAFGTLFWRYVRLVVLPVALRPSYTYVAPHLAVSLLGLLALAAAVGAIALALFRRKTWALGAALFVLALAPVSHVLMPFWIPMAERYLVLPLVGAVPLLVAFVLTRKRRKAAVALLCLVAAAFAFGAGKRALDWRTPLALWSKAVDAEPLDPVSWTNYAAGLSAYARFADAADAHRRAWELAQVTGKDNADHLINYALNLSMAGKSGKACELLRSERRRYPDNVDLLLAMGDVCVQVNPCFHKQFNPYKKVMLLADPEKYGRLDAYCRAWAGYCACKFTDCQDREDEEKWKRCGRNGYALLQLAALHAAAGDNAKAVRAVGLAMRTPQWPQVRASALRFLESLKK